jgi:Cdc6-like AAA superfamily ATPase
MDSNKKQPIITQAYQLGDDVATIIPSSIACELDIKVNSQLGWYINRNNGQAYLSPVVKPLSRHANLVLTAIQALGVGCITGNVYKKYSELAGSSGKNPLTSRRISGIVKEIEERGLIKTEAISYGRHGRTTRITGIFAQPETQPEK